MASRKNPLSEKAYEMYKSGMKLKDIASHLGKPEGTIRRWKSTYGWDSERSEKKSERSDMSKKNKWKPLDDGTKETIQNDDLTPGRQMFCVYYNRTFNATQSYQKAFGCKYETAMVEGCKLLRNPRIREELDRLKEIKRQQIVAGTDDIVELQMRIAFADIGYYMQFGRAEVEVMGPFGPIKDEETGEVITREVNTVRLNESDNVDTQIIQEVKQGRDGVSIKLADKQKAIEWLTNYFEANPQDKHKREFDKRRLEIELLKLEMQVKDNCEKTQDKDNFLDALNESAKEVWSDD